MYLAVGSHRRITDLTVFVTRLSASPKVAAATADTKRPDSSPNLKSVVPGSNEIKSSLSADGPKSTSNKLKRSNHSKPWKYHDYDKPHVTKTIYLNVKRAIARPPLAREKNPHISKYLPHILT
jgi:hypothetical protein